MKSSTKDLTINSKVFMAIYLGQREDGSAIYDFAPAEIEKINTSSVYTYSNALNKYMVFKRKSSFPLKGEDIYGQKIILTDDEDFVNRQNKSIESEIDKNIENIIAKLKEKDIKTQYELLSKMEALINQQR